MKIGEAGSTAATTGVRKLRGKTRADGTGFADVLDETVGTPGDATVVEGTVSLSGVDAILAAQSVDPDESSRRRLAGRGEDILDRLDEVRLGLLAGAIPKGRLVDLARLVRSRRGEEIDPRLDAILDEIELRAEVEIAKLTRRD